MKILFITDTHLNVKLFNHLTVDGLPARAEEFVSVFKWLSELCDEKDIDRVVFGGDLFNTVSDLKMPFFNLAFWALDQLNRPLDILDGNHDKYDAVYRALEPFKKLGRVYSEPAAYYDNNVEKRLVFFPFQREKQQAEADLNKLLRPNEETLVFMHQGITGLFPDELAIDSSLFKKHKQVEKVFAGHYHFNHTGGNVYFPGSLFSLHFGDSFEEKKFVYIYDTKTNKIEKVENTLACKFLSVQNGQMIEVLDELEEVAPYTYLRVLVNKDEPLSVDTSFLRKFKGYITVKDTKKDKQEIQYQVDYTQKEEEHLNISDLKSLDGESLSCDLSFDDFRQLILTCSKDRELLDETSEEKLDEVMNEAFQLGRS